MGLHQNQNFYLSKDTIKSEKASHKMGKIFAKHTFESSGSTHIATKYTRNLFNTITRKATLQLRNEQKNKDLSAS